MGTISQQFATAFRDFAVDGVSSSGPHEVVKEEVRAIGPIIETALGVGLLGNVDVAYATRAALEADLAHAANSIGLVYADPVDANNDLYVKSGASGSGSWTLTAIIHTALENVAIDYIEAAVSGGTGDIGDAVAAGLASINGSIAIAVSAIESAGALATGTTIPAEVAAVIAALAAARIAVEEAADEYVNTVIPGRTDSLFSYVDDAASEIAADRAAVALDRDTVTGLVATAQAIALGEYVDAEGNLVLGGPGTAAGPNGDNVILGGANGMIGDKGFYAGADAGRGSIAYSSPFIGWYTGARFIGDFSAAYGTHALQDTNQAGREFPGIGAAATGSIIFATTPNDGETVTINGIAFTARTSPSGGYEFARGASAGDAAKALIAKVLAATDTALKLAFYRLNQSSGGTVFLRSTSQGTYGNSFTLAASGPNITVSGATLAGGGAVVNNGNRLSTVGEVGVGFYAGADSDRPPAGRRGQVTLSFSGQPEDGASIALGLNLTSANTARFRTTPSGLLDIDRGASREEALVNATAVLNGSTNTTVDDCTYWAGHGGALFIETDAVGVNSFEVRPFATSVITAPFNVAAGAYAAFGTPNLALGFNSGVNVLGSGNITLSGGSSTTGVTNFVAGGAGIQGNGNFLWGGGFAFTEGDDNIAIGRGLTNGGVQAWQAVQSINSDGVVTFVEPHGWTQGERFFCQYRDRTAGGTVIQIVPDGQLPGGTPGSPSTIPTGLGGLALVPINAMQARIQQGSGPITGDRDDGYQVSGTVTNIDIARALQRTEMSITFGFGAAAVSRRVSIGSRRYTEGTLIDTVGFQLGRGEFRLPVIIPGTPGSGNILFPTANGNFADGETVTLNGTVFTAKAASAFATPNNSMIRWFRIGADMWESLNNLLICLRHSDDQSTAARNAAVPGRFWLTATTGGGWRLNFQSYEFGGTAYTLATSKTGAVVTAVTVGGLGNLLVSSSLYPPRDGGLVHLSASPANNNQPGLARYRLSTNSWLALPA